MPLEEKTYDLPLKTLVNLQSVNRVVAFQTEREPQQQEPQQQQQNEEASPQEKQPEEQLLAPVTERQASPVAEDVVNGSNKPVAETVEVIMSYICKGARRKSVEILSSLACCL